MHDSAFSFYLRNHRVNGYTEPGLATFYAEQLLKGLEGLPPETGQKRIALAVGLLRQALLLNPFDKQLRGLVNQLANPAPASEIFTAWLGACNKVLDDTDEISISNAMEQAEAWKHDELRLRDTALNHHSLCLRHVCLIKLWELGNLPYFTDAACAVASSEAGPLICGLYAFAAHSAGDAALCEGLLSRALINPLTLNLKAERAAAAGDTETARGLLLRSLDALPVQIHLLLRLHELLSPPQPPTLSSLNNDARVSVLLYTWNKLDVTMDTLRSLLDSDIGDAHVTLLNNGSTAFTPEDFAAAVGNVAQGRQVEVIQLPVNIGAPAARNWLWQLESSLKADYVAFLDDDVFLPSNWLRCFLQDAAEYPEATVIGSRVMSPGDIPTIQYAARFFSQTATNHIRFTSTAPLFMDMQQYTYRRPSLSVMGCCHLFNRKACERLNVPGFDVRFTPSQIDDIEHDIQVWLSGGTVLYDGRVCVVHRQNAGGAPLRTEANSGHEWGNHMKMEMKLSGDQLDSVDRQVQARDEAHLKCCVRKALPELSQRTKTFFAQCGLLDG
ncbi:glycosyltransferase [Desulfovibrio mangrovi]|uniref:glycosyltransferase family 2 protein n=1 Tax=Desulfovibrio mangrovi TaxID=2976983 RepID=UPI0022469D34|nr:glycosyltransferase [Desulfovibrio mangrovi]UZP66291.1 glycosyltransferase [Desulfovibrio mangrovi]